MSGDYVERLRGLTGPGVTRVQLSADRVRDLEAALDELERLRAEDAELGDAEHQWRIVTPNGPSHSFTQRDLDNRADWLPGVRLEQRTVYGTPWVDADATPQQPGRCSCGCPKVGDGCNCQWCNEPYPTQQPAPDGGD